MFNREGGIFNFFTDFPELKFPVVLHLYFLLGEMPPVFARKDLLLKYESYPHCQDGITHRNNLNCLKDY